MDDLSTLDWSTKPETARKAQPFRVPLPASASLGPTPSTSGPSSFSPRRPSNSPFNVQSSGNDSFSNLVSFSSAPSHKSLSLQEQQKKLLEQKAQQQEAKQKILSSQYSGGDEKFWDRLGSGRSTPAVTSSSAVSGSQQLEDIPASNHNGIVETEDDILAAFRADTPVDSSSHFPKPIEPLVAPSDARQPSSSTLPILGSTVNGSDSHGLYAFDDDDPFGLAELPGKRSGKLQEPSFQNNVRNEEEDVLGLLGKPLSELPKPQKMAGSLPEATEQTATHPQDEAMTELMEMGFPAARAREALEHTESGTDIQQAVSWLLNEAHSESRQTARTRRRSNDRTHQNKDPRLHRASGSTPNGSQSQIFEQAPLRYQLPDRSTHQRSPTAPNRSEKDPAQMASDLGATFLKTAGSFWKTSTKKVQQAVHEFNSDSDSSQPRWMREPGIARNGQGSDDDQVERAATRSRRRRSTNKKLSVTDEAMLLESDQARPPARKPPRRQGPAHDSSGQNSRGQSPAMPTHFRQEFPVQPAFLHQQRPQARSRLDLKAALNRQAIDDEASQAYVSTARKRQTAFKPSLSVSEPDLLENTLPPSPSSATQPAPIQTSRADPASQPAKPAVRLPPALSRKIPPTAPLSLKASHADRAAGNDYFKRGDYNAAHQSYTSSLRHLPANHPLSIILLTNRALTALKIGEPKVAISDSETAIAVIGPSRGEAETIDPSNGDPPKPMRDYYGRALMRKAEALEQVEKWKEAASVWREAVESGHGGATSIEGRLRCEKAAAPQIPKRARSAPGKKLVTAVQLPPAIAEVSGSADRIPPAAAVQRLRDANAAADRIDDEKFALADTVDAKLAAWRGSKTENLRALLASLDMVLWPEAGWKKTGMAELVLPAKVKVQYMKGIGKVHPDKLPTTATTEQRMIAGAVFSTLNDAWDKFKAENGL